jgi:hypothetical protein
MKFSKTKIEKDKYLFLIFCFKDFLIFLFNTLNSINFS